MTTLPTEINETLSLDPKSYSLRKTSTFIPPHRVNLVRPYCLVETHDAQYIAIANFMYLYLIKAKH
jgi:hypothetical protein